MYVDCKVKINFVSLLKMYINFQSKQATLVNELEHTLQRHKTDTGIMGGAYQMFNRAAILRPYAYGISDIY